MTTQAEIERKYEVDDDAVVPDFDGVGPIGSAREVGRFGLVAQYFDTADEDLAARRITLRRREGGTDEGWHIKLPASEGRTELHWPLDTPLGAGDVVPDGVLAPVRAIVRDRPMAPLARLVTARRIVHLVDAAGRELAEIADDLVTGSDAATGTARVWREWEAELLPGAPDTADARTALLDAIEGRLLSAGARPASSASKLATALGRTELGAAHASARSVDDDASAGEVLSVAIRALRDEVVGLDRRVRADEPDAVHQLRTRVRRLRSLLASYRDVVGDSADLRDRFRAFGAVLGRVRDAEVMRSRAGDLVDTHDEVDRAAHEVLLTGWDAEYASARALLLRELSGERYFRLFDALDDLADRDPSGAAASAPVGEVAPRILHRDLRRVRRRAKRADAADGPERDGLLHETRKAAKRLRYAAEAVSSGASAVLGGSVRRLGADAEAVHDLLGEYRDSTLLQAHLRTRAARDGHPFDYGLLYELERHAAALALAEYVPARKRLLAHRR